MYPMCVAQLVTHIKLVGEEPKFDPHKTQKNYNILIC